MKPKHPFPLLQLALLGMPFLLLSSAAQAQDQSKDQKAAEVAKTEQTEEEKANASRAKEVAERAKEAAERAKAATEVAEAKKAAEENGNARRMKEAAERAKAATEVAETKKAVEENDNASRVQEAVERAKAAAEVAKTKKAVEENGNARRAKEEAERAKVAAEIAETKKAVEERGNARRAKAAAEAIEAAKVAVVKKRADAEAPIKSEDDAKPGTPARGQGRGETPPGTKERTASPPPREPGEARERGERPARPVTPVTPATGTPPATPGSPPATPITPANPVSPPAPPADENKPPIDMPVVPSRPLKPRENVKPRGNEAAPSTEAPPAVAPGQPEVRKRAEIPATEPERLAESQVAEVTREVQRDLDQRKTRIVGREAAQALIDEILGAKSRISRAEIAREERFRPRFERQRQRPGEEERLPEVSPDQRRAATTYFQERLRGREVDGPPPEFFARSQQRGDRLDPRVTERVVERVEFVRPRYLNEGRRYVHFDSRAAIPAILMAAQAMNQVRFQPARDVAPMFYEHQEGSTAQALPLPPENFRDENSLVVSYPVDEKSMISSEDILFLQGSTQFSDPYSYEVIAVMADAMKALPEDDRFVIEGHASAEGSYESNMVLSQQRAEHIVREIVRRGVSPYRLLPVGYGESEARRSADATEALRSQDRRVVVFRMKPEPVAKR
jgi:outer membrane protein OmpA-like peptidoglycan-associated protein